MPPKNQNKKKNLSKEDKRLESYLSHPANQTQDTAGAQNKKNKGTSKDAQTGNSSTDNQIVDLLKEVDLSKPLPDFTPLDNSIATLRTTVEDMDNLILNIESNNADALGKPPADEPTSLKGQTLSQEILRKKDSIIRDVHKTIEMLDAKRNRVIQLLNMENMGDMKDELNSLVTNISEDIKQKEQILEMF